MAAAVSPEILISADSHMSEPPRLWDERLPAKFTDRFIRPSQVNSNHDIHHPRSGRPGGWDPQARLKDMAIDGMAAEVLYPSSAIQIYRREDKELQAAASRAYNDWLIEYCSEAPDRLWGQGIISLWDIDVAIEEMTRCRNAGLLGATIWLCPPNELPFNSPHYERFWAAAQDLSMPVSMHINMGYGHYVRMAAEGDGTVDSHRRSLNQNKAAAMNVLLDIIGYGVLERYPKLKIILAEVDGGWVPFWLQEADHFFKFKKLPKPLSLTPTEYFERQCYTTFMDDEVAGFLLTRYCQNNLLWASDYPHANGVWPKSREVIARTLGHLPSDVRRNIIGLECARLYGMPVPPLMEPETDGIDKSQWTERAHMLEQSRA
jgi:predicted TIM-barrel fold metal-dependent hydrolase